MINGGRVEPVPPTPPDLPLPTPVTQEEFIREMGLPQVAFSVITNLFVPNLPAIQFMRVENMGEPDLPQVLYSVVTYQGQLKASMGVSVHENQ